MANHPPQDLKTGPPTPVAATPPKATQPGTEPTIGELQSDRSATIQIYLMVLILLLYLLLSLYQIRLPGLHYDEAFEAVPALQLLLGQPVTTFRNNGWQVGNQRFPFMTQDYIGAINTYAAIPFIALFGSTPTALRVMSILMGAATLLLTYRLSGSLTGNSWVGLAAMVLLAVDPTFVFWNRQGIFVTAVTAPIGLGATLCWLQRLRSGSIGWSVAGAFLFGLGLYAKFLFLWLIVALVGAAALLHLPRVIRHRGELMARWQNKMVEISGVVGAFLLGSWPLIAYNLQTGGTFSSITENASTSYYGVDNLAFGPNLIERLKQFYSFLNGSHLWYLGEIVNNPLPSLFFSLILISVVLIGFMATRKFSSVGGSPPSDSPVKIALFPFITIALVVLASVGTVSALWITHYAVLMPWPALAIAVGGWFILGQVNRSEKIELTESLRHPLFGTTSLITLLVGVGLGLLLLTNLISTFRYHRALSESGGLSTHSDAVYDLTAWLAANDAGPVASMDWGLSAPVIYLTHGRVAAVEVFGYDWQSDAQLTDRLHDYIVEPETFYLWRAPDEIIFDRSQEFKALYRPLGLEEDIEAAFYERSGRPLLGITRLVEQGTAENPPQ